MRHKSKFQLLPKRRSEFKSYIEVRLASLSINRIQIRSLKHLKNIVQRAPKYTLKVKIKMFKICTEARNLYSKNWKN